MKCIYCNSENELTSSDIITYAITGAKLTKSFVCKTHNAFTNDNYEKKFISDMGFFRNHLGLTTRDGNPIQYKADLTVDGMQMYNVTISGRKSLYAPKGVVSGVDGNGNKILMAPMDKMEKISKGRASVVDISDVTIHKTIEADCFLGYHAIHCMAKMAYEWYCYINGIEEFIQENNEIVEYILGKNDGEFVDIIIDRNYYFAIDQVSEIGTNAFFQYDDIDGYRYVVLDFWNTVSYRVKICKSPSGNSRDVQFLFFKLYLYHIDGKRTQTAFGTYSLDSNKKPKFITIEPRNITVDMWRTFANRIEKIMSTVVLSIYTLKREVDKISSKLDKYDSGKIDVAHLLEFEENNVVIVLDIISHLYFNKEKYDISKSFNQNLPVIINLSGDTIVKTQEQKQEFIKALVTMDREKKLSEYIRNSISFFYEIYQNEMNLGG